jgi:cytidylate kinase
MKTESEEGNKMKHLNIAIDGPAGAGKSTIAKEIARRLGFIYLDTGAMYRAFALKALNQGISPKDIEGIVSLISKTEIDIHYKDGHQIIMLDGKDVTNEIRTPQVSESASDVAAIPEVRLMMVRLQRKIAEQNDVVMDGRDIGTYVLPDANRKFFITASTEERAYRRWLEQKEKGYNASLEVVRKEIEKRDYNDSNRSFAPLRKAEDAILIDTTHLNVEEVIELILGYL